MNIELLDTNAARRNADDLIEYWRAVFHKAAGVIPGYARSANGAFDGSVFYYKQLDPLVAHRLPFITPTDGTLLATRCPGLT